MHHLWPHLLTFPRFLDPINWLWLSVKGYAFTSSGLQLTLPAGVVLWLRRHNCHAKWCPRFGRHPTADGHHHLCRRHHPDIPAAGLTLQEIHDRHHEARRQRSSASVD